MAKANRGGKRASGGTSRIIATGGGVRPLNEELAEKRMIAAEHFKRIGAEVDQNGMVTLYHATSPQNAESIRENGFKPTSAPVNGAFVDDLKDRVFFGHDKQWVENNWSSDGYEIMKVKIPAEYLHQAGRNTSEVFVEGRIKKTGSVWVPDTKPTSTAWDRILVKRWKKRNS